MVGWHRSALSFVGFTAVLVVIAGVPATTVAAKKMKADLAAQVRDATLRLYTEAAAYAVEHNLKEYIQN